MRMAVRARERERGAGPVSVILILAFLALVFTAGVTATGTFASNESAGAQHAADAAALAGAGGVVDTIPTALAPGFLTTSEIPLLLGGGPCVQTGRLQATQLAIENDATITSYCYNVWTDEVTVHVRLNDTNTTSTHTAVAHATAATSFRANACELDPGFTPPTGKPKGTPPKTWVDCGFGRLTIVWNPTLERFQFLELPAIPAMLTPKLTA